MSSPSEPRPSNFIRDIVIEDLKTKKFGDATVVDDLSLQIMPFGRTTGIGPLNADFGTPATSVTELHVSPPSPDQRRPSWKLVVSTYAR